MNRFVKDSRFSGQASIVVADPLTGQTIAQYRPTAATTPASNMKLETALAALEILGPDRTFPTSASLAGDTLYLVGGGDVNLADGKGDPTATEGRASLLELAKATAAELTKSGAKEVKFAVDSTLFAGPLFHQDIGADEGPLYIMESRPLAVNEGLKNGKHAPDPDLEAGRAFAQALADAGVKVGEPTRAAAPADARKLAEVRSAPLRDLVETMLKHSDNTIAETLGRLIAIEKGKPATFAGAGEAVKEYLVGAGFDVSGAVFSSASGLSTTDRLTARLQSEIMLKAWEDPKLSGIGPGLPVSALDGTLARRMIDTPLAGVVRAKTGTLVEANSLSGYLQTAKGQPLVFSILIDHIEEGKSPGMRAVIDSFLADLAAL